MKKTTLRAALAAALLLTIGSSRADAASWRINNDASKHAHFTDINAAMSSSDVVNGDTLYLDPGCLLTAAQNVTKQVNIIGTGWLLPTSAHQQATVKAALNLKAAGIKVEGTEVTGTTTLSANNITLERCKLGYVTYSGTAQFATIRQCYIPNNRINGAGTAKNNTANWTIENCIIIYTDNYDPIANLYQPVIRNNYIRPNYKNNSASVSYVTGAIMVNNICINTKFITDATPYEAYDCIVTNNVFHAEGLRTKYPDNIFITSNTEEAVFALEGQNDQRYTLKEGSPAIGAATDGGDCGPTGGLYPYVPSGFPFGMPHFNSSNIGARPESGQVKVSQQVVIQNQ